MHVNLSHRNIWHITMTTKFHYHNNYIIIHTCSTITWEYLGILRQRQNGISGVPYEAI